MRTILRTGLFLAIIVALTGPALYAQRGEAISLTVDATQVPLGIVRTHMVMPVHSGPLTLYYPKWIPGEHGPDGPISNVTGLKFSADGKAVPWERDKLDVFTFHVNVPEGATRLDVNFDYIEPLAGGFASGAASSTDKLVVISWNQNVLYPAGKPADAIMFDAKLKVPEGWKYGTPLPVENSSGNEISFKPVALDRLVDSPVISGEYYRAVDITPPGDKIHHELDLAADSEAALAISKRHQAAPGETHASAKLTEDDVRAIRARYATGGISQPQLAAEYGVKPETISALLRGLTWKHVR